MPCSRLFRAIFWSWSLNPRLWGRGSYDSDPHTADLGLNFNASFREIPQPSSQRGRNKLHSGSPRAPRISPNSERKPRDPEQVTLKLTQRHPSTSLGMTN